MRKWTMVVVVALAGCGGDDALFQAAEPVADAAPESAQDAPWADQGTDAQAEAEAATEAGPEGAADAPEEPEAGDASGEAEAGNADAPWEAEVGQDAEPEAEADAPAPPCLPGMVQVGSFCIDSTEVTRAAYEAWLASFPVPSNTSPECVGNATFAPEPSCVSAPTVCHGVGCGSHPQVCVDWCDAKAFCEAAGKRLCGGVGGAALNAAHLADPHVDEWHGGCTTAGGSVYPYGTFYQPTWCNGENALKGTTAPSASMALCTTPMKSGIFDMSGNAAEWEDYTEFHASASTRGGSFASNKSSLACSQHTMLPIATHSPEIGFRCCGP